MRPARRVVKIVRGHLLKMSIDFMSTDVRAQTVDLLIRCPRVEIEGRNALHRALKHGIDVGICYEDGEEAVYQGELTAVSG